MTTEKKTVYVIMGNDYPDSVFDTEGVANAYVEEKKAEEKKLGRLPPIYWRSYPFVLNRRDYE